MSDIRPPAPPGSGDPHDPPPGTPNTRQAVPAMLDSQALLRGQASVAIHHQGTVYRLHATKLGKLILTK